MTSWSRRQSDLELTQCACAVYWRRSRICLLILVVLALILAGCGATMTDSPGGARSVRPASTRGTFGQGSETDHAAVPVIMRDPAPGMLDITMTVTFEQQSGDTQPMTEVDLAFLSGDHPVQFAGNEHINCDGVVLSLKDRVAVFQVLRAPTAQVAGTTVQCTYAAGSKMAGVALRIPPTPAITSPQMGAQVVRGTHTLVTYRFDLATGTMLGIVALAAPSSPMPKAIAKMNVPGPWQATVDTSRLLPGPSSLVLTLSLTPRTIESGSAFHSVHAFGSVTVQVAVTWI